MPCETPGVEILSSADAIVDSFGVYAVLIFPD
jgi:hypothetical protein